MTRDEKFMLLALEEAKKAQAIDEVPIGCVIVRNEEIIASSFNKKESEQDPTGHAEIQAIREACKKLHNWRLIDCELYVTLEPCIMCSGAIIQSRIKRVIFGANDPKGGALGSSIDVTSANNINHHVEITSGILKDECSKILTNYFKEKRK